MILTTHFMILSSNVYTCRNLLMEKIKNADASSSHNTSLPNSVDKILETIITLIDTDTPELSEEQQNILHSLELELDTCT